MCTSSTSPHVRLREASRACPWKEGMVTGRPDVGLTGIGAHQPVHKRAATISTYLSIYLPSPMKIGSFNLNVTRVLRLCLIMVLPTIDCRANTPKMSTETTHNISDVPIFPFNCLVYSILGVRTGWGSEFTKAPKSLTPRFASGRIISKWFT